ncbi:MAG TPA: polysaccharide deacetylase [Chthonomonadaceae bacterium]|nr:polysaccharide deacetylase [Chthonomonadaceae bacterium]
MREHYVCLTFDFDAISPWIFRGMTTPTPISRGEFGIVGAARLLDLLARYDIQATWFVPGHTLETYPDICRRIYAEGHEIAHHGYLHEPPATLSYEEERAVLLRGNDAIMRATGAPARGYRSPSWDLSPHTVELLLEHGFDYDSSMMAHDHHPYFARQGDLFPRDQPAQFGRETRLIEMPISWSLDDYPHFEFNRTETGLLPGLQRADDVLANWLDDFRYMARTEEWGLLTYTMHPQVIGRGHRMIMLERLIQSLRELGAQFARMDAMAEAFALLADISQSPGRRRVSGQG